MNKLAFCLILLFAMGCREKYEVFPGTKDLSILVVEGFNFL